jgi:hypothetical protein
MRQLVIVTVLTMWVGCSSTAPTVRLNQDFVLAPGETSRITGADITIRFVGVQNDSRCPADAICVQGGDAIVRIEVLSSVAAAKAYDLHTGDMRPVLHEDLTIALVQLVPYPFSSRPTQPGDYRATLRVTR